LEAARHEISTCIKRDGKELIGFGQGTQVGKSSSRALEGPRHEINMFIKRIETDIMDKEFRFGKRFQGMT